MKSPANNARRPRPLCPALCAMACSMLLLAGMPATLHAQVVKGGEKSLTAADATAASLTSSQGLGQFGRMLPVGQKNLDVKIPSFRDGRPNSLVRAGSMTRLDDENMAIEKMDIRMFGPSKDRDVRVQLRTATYHMPTQILSSEDRSRISREDFQMEGDSMVFDTKTQQGKMVGNVSMVIFDTESFTSGDALSSGTAPENAAPPPMEIDEAEGEPAPATPATPPAPTVDINAKAVEKPAAPAPQAAPAPPAPAAKP